ncbi:hypothetical protein CEJ58_20140, partial [Acinetobacter baumannii]
DHGPLNSSDTMTGDDPDGLLPVSQPEGADDKINLCRNLAVYRVFQDHGNNHGACFPRLQLAKAYLVPVRVQLQAFWHGQRQ